MFRIDNNTYIDTSLITCAEYQLFIDEMWKRGKHFQPYHWHSYQFPVGQAQFPILGISPSDSVSFCDWLTRRGNPEWKYRIPTKEEAINYPIQPAFTSPSGYWVISQQIYEEFFWIIGVYDDNLVLNFDTDNDLYLARKIASAIANVLIENLRSALAKELEHNDLDLARSLYRANNRVLNSELIHMRNLACSRNDNQGDSFTGVLVEAYGNALTYARNLADSHSLTSNLGLIITHDSNLAVARARTRDYALVTARNLANNRNLSHSRIRDLAHDLADYILLYDYLEIALQFKTLHQRIIGAMPAVEGLRIVKERISDAS